MAITMPIPVTTTVRVPVDVVMERAHSTVYGLENAELVKQLARGLGRPTVARLADAPDLKTVTRWSLGRNTPVPDRMDRLRHAGVAYFALLELGLSETNAEQWFRGANPSLGYAMPVDAIRDGRYVDVFAAVRNHAGG